MIPTGAPQNSVGWHEEAKAKEHSISITRGSIRLQSTSAELSLHPGIFCNSTLQPANIFFKYSSQRGLRTNFAVSAVLLWINSRRHSIRGIKLLARARAEINSLRYAADLCAVTNHKCTLLLGSILWRFLTQGGTLSMSHA